MIPTRVILVELKRNDWMYLDVRVYLEMMTMGLADVECEEEEREVSKVIQYSKIWTPEYIKTGRDLSLRRLKVLPGSKMSDICQIIKWLTQVGRCVYRSEAQRKEVA